MTTNATSQSMVARTIRSLRVCAHINLRQAKHAKQSGRERLARYHVEVALRCRADANSLASTSH